MNTNGLCNEPCLILLIFQSNCISLQNYFIIVIVKLIIGDIPVDAILQNGDQESYLEKDV